MADKPSVEPRRGLSLLQKAVVAVFALTLVGSVALRASAGTAQPAASGAPTGAQGLTAGGGGVAAAEPGRLETCLPYVTEASLCGLIGFALGYTTRKVFKLALILIALAFLVVQALTYAGWIEVDWGGLSGQLNGWILHLEQSAGLTAFLTDRIPSAGALLAGWLVGLWRG